MDNENCFKLGVGNMENCNTEILSSRPDVFQPLVRSLFSTATAYSIFMDGGVVGGEERAGVGQGARRA